MRLADEPVQVNIICATYNHEKYIKDALDGFLMQKTSFKYTVLLHDDASTDKTTEIVREYAAKYPEIILPYYEQENQYSKHNGMINKIQSGRANAKYIAFCEGDDYWTDPNKLQKQFDAMEENPSIRICAHTASKVDSESKDVLGLVQPSKTNCVFSTEDVILGGGGFVASSSLFMRKDVYTMPMRFRQFLLLDYTLQMQGSIDAGMLYLADNMSCYRIASKGSWTESIRKSSDAFIQHAQKVNKALRILNHETNRKYSAAIRKHIWDNRKLILKAKIGAILK